MIKKGDFTDIDVIQNRALPESCPLEFARRSALVAKVVILGNHKFTQDEIATADHLTQFKSYLNVADFPGIIAGIAHAGLEVAKRTPL